MSGMPPELGPGARASILAKADEAEWAAPEKKKVGLVKARAAALRAAREAVLGVLEELAFHLAAVVGRWRERLAGNEAETAGRGEAFGPSPHGAPQPPPKRTAAEVEEELPEVLSQEQAAESRAARLTGRAEGRRVAAEKAEAAVGARPLHVTSQLGLVAQRRLRAEGWEVRWEAVEARRAEQARAGGEVTPPPPVAVRGGGGTGGAEAGRPAGLEPGGGVGGGADAGRGATEPPRGEEAVGAGGRLSARASARSCKKTALSLSVCGRCALDVRRALPPAVFPP